MNVLSHLTVIGLFLLAGCGAPMIPVDGTEDRPNPKPQTSPLKSGIYRGIGNCATTAIDPGNGPRRSIDDFPTAFTFAIGTNGLPLIDGVEAHNGQQRMVEIGPSDSIADVKSLSTLSNGVILEYAITMNITSQSDDLIFTGPLRETYTLISDEEILISSDMTVASEEGHNLLISCTVNVSTNVNDFQEPELTAKNYCDLDSFRYISASYETKRTVIEELKAQNISKLELLSVSGETCNEVCDSSNCAMSCSDCAVAIIDEVYAQNSDPTG